MEQMLVLELRTAFRIPLTCETPVELIKHGAVSYRENIGTKIC